MSNLKSALVPIAYGVIVVVGGLMGYLQAQSLVSLITGLVFGLPIIGAGLTMLRGIRSGFYTAIVLAIALTLFFHYRFVVTQTFMPAGLMAVISILALIGMFVWRPKEK